MSNDDFTIDDRRQTDYSEWFIASEINPVYTGFYECVYDHDFDENSVMRWFDVDEGKWYCVNEITGQAMLNQQACFGWGRDKWRGQWKQLSG